MTKILEFFKRYLDECNIEGDFWGEKMQNKSMNYLNLNLS